MPQRTRYKVRGWNRTTFKDDTIEDYASSPEEAIAKSDFGEASVISTTQVSELRYRAELFLSMVLVVGMLYVAVMTCRMAVTPMSEVRTWPFWGPVVNVVFPKRDSRIPDYCFEDPEGCYGREPGRFMP